MIHKYTVLVFIALCLSPLGLESQEIRIFNIEDFDLIGNVKSCLVINKYGKEEYEFNKKGFLTKSVTRFNDSDYDITYYKYSGPLLIEKRFENYRNNTFDPTTSIANIYVIDSTENMRITEKIMSYDKEFLDQYEYFYRNDALRKIVRTNKKGIDETLISYTDLKGEQTTSYSMHDFPLKSVRTSVKKEKDSVLEKTILTKLFLEGEPLSATEEIFNGQGKIKSKTNFFYDENTRQFTKDAHSTYHYDASAMLMSVETETDSTVEKKEYIYQFDPNGNWVKEIITPDNTYKTRIITYFEVPKE